MDMLIELVVDLLFDAGLEVTKNKKISKWIRYPLIVLILLFFIMIIIGIAYLGIFLIESKEIKQICIGVFLITLSLIFLGVLLKNILEEKMK